VCVSERFTAASTPYQRELERHRSREGDKTGRCSSRGKEMQITQTHVVEVLHSKPPGVSVETKWCIVLFINTFVFSITKLLK
jgi:hypothetical protein